MATEGWQPFSKTHEELKQRFESDLEEYVRRLPQQDLVERPLMELNSWVVSHLDQKWPVTPEVDFTPDTTRVAFDAKFDGGRELTTVILSWPLFGDPQLLEYQPSSGGPQLRGHLALDSEESRLFLIYFVSDPSSGDCTELAQEDAQKLESG